ncbi:hatching enzyme 1.2-like isoform X2 [Nerophis ophidion]|uniref:hatching enzyme 1.2-like isoform X2 n=1 Tax=Nerophis ophidion TaxID=159077 RepID=UPI002AE06529|nr:hatching enzyme 1.2-like isoform X2 [Nerophis ophidion]
MASPGDRVRKDSGTNMLLLLCVCVLSVSAVSAGNQSHYVTISPATGMSVNATQNAVTLQDPRKEQHSAETLEGLNDDMRVEEGDILMQEDRNAVRSVWQDATMPYVISRELKSRKADILRALKMISDVTCIRFKEHENEMSYIRFKNGRGCASFVGCRGGEQKLYFSESCSVGNLCHEVMHALGLHHEHTREDRDEHITVQWRNIIPRKKEYFKIKKGRTFDIPYDVGSIMHYGKYFFSSGRGPTLVPKQSSIHLGQRTHLSKLDALRLNTLYRCGKE